MTTTGPKILWNSHDPLMSGSGEERVPDRFDFPFDVDVGPPSCRVSDRWNIEGTPNPQGTWTLYPIQTPSPQPTSTAPAWSPTFTRIPELIPTPYPWIHRVSRNRLGLFEWTADRNGGCFRKIVIRRLKIRNGQPAEFIIYPTVGTPVQIVLPVDVEAVGNPAD